MSDRNPVLLIHGLHDTTRVFRTMSAYLSKRSWSVYHFDLTPNNGDLGLDQLAVQVANYVKQNFAPDQPIDLIGFSMGGLVSRYYVQRLGGIERVQRFICISAPNYGTQLAYVYWWRSGCVQMRPNSAFLQDLNRDCYRLKQLNFTVIWTPFDAMIVPARSSAMPVGKEIIVPTLLHSWMLSDPRCHKVVEQALSEPVSVKNC